VELFKVLAAINIVGVAYRSDAETITAVMSETVQLAIPNIAVALPLIREGKLRALGITSPRRTPLAADIPAVTKVVWQTMRSFHSSVWSLQPEPHNP
jgi:tripartite-type tricarboxylate transporter receptor subunit TctC